MRVLYCIPTLESGGAERQVCYLARALSARGVEVHVALLRGGANWDRAQASGATVHLLPHRSHHDPALLLALLRLMGRVRPDLVQTWLPQMDVLAGLAAVLRGVPLVLSERSSASAYRPTWKNRLRRLLGARAAGIVANSAAGARYWKGVAPAERIALIRNIVPVEEIRGTARPGRAALGLDEDAELVLYVGRYSYEKNLPTLLQALGRVAAARPRAVALLHGDGPEKDAVAALAGRPGMEGRIRVGELTPDAWALMRAAQVFVSISDFEGSPNAVLEAAACGCPLVLSDIPSHRELFDGESAWLVPPRSAEAVAAAIEAALSDPERARRQAESAARAVADATGAAIAEQYLRVYGQIVGSRPAMPPGRT
jgi:glycosyltransferase involved in cell wall biosynthesis